MSFWVYILRCRDDSYYTGHTDNLEQRIEQHKSRAFPTCYTATRLPVELVFVQELATREEALASERQIKGWGRKKKEAMMRGDWKEVSRLAQNALRQAQGERLVTVRGESVAVRGAPVAIRGAPVAVRGAPVAVRGEPVAVRGEPVAVRGEPVEPHAGNANQKV